MTIETHPVQTRQYRLVSARLRTEVTLRAYEVYKHCYGAQEEIITGNCRGGFSAGEIIAFLYAHSFPQAQWRDRVDEAFREMRGL